MLNRFSGSVEAACRIVMSPEAMTVLANEDVGSFNEIAEYLELRYELPNLGVMSVEECDMAVAFHNPHRGKDVISLFRKALKQNPELDKAFYLQGMYVSAHAAVEQPQPTDHAQWKQEFYDAAQPVPIW
jgi:hypothetical protein